MSFSDASSSSSSSTDEVQESLFTLQSVMRDLETLVTATMIGAPSSVPTAPQQANGLPPTHPEPRCPHDHSQKTRTEVGRQSISRGCPFEQSKTDRRISQVRFSQPEILGTESFDAPEPPVPSSNRGCPVLNQLVGCPYSDVLNDLPKGEELDVDLTVKEKVVVTSGEETVSEKASKNIFHLRRAPSGEFLPRTDLDHDNMVAVSSPVEVGSPIEMPGEEQPRGEIMWEQTSEFEQEEHGPGPLRKVKSKENIRMYRSISQERQKEEELSPDGQEMLETIREVRQKIKTLQGKLEEWTRDSIE